MTNKQMKLPGPDHPISIEKSRSRVVVTVGGKVYPDRIDEIRVTEASVPGIGGLAGALP
jgi:uncharacterized protein (DUF427 family)